MSQRVDVPREAVTATPDRSEITLAGTLLAVGLLLNVLVTLFHPGGREDSHRAIFTAYADSDAWIAVHLGQFVAVLIALAGLLVLYRFLRHTRRSSVLAHLAAASTVAAAATWAVLQGLDGVGLKAAVDTWVSAPAAARQTRFADAETVRWLEWGFQSYFRLLLGLSLVLFGAAILAGRRIATWLGWTAVLAGLCSLVIGVDVGYSGLESELQDLLSIAFLVVALVLAVGMIAAGARERGQHAHTATRHPVG
ncbi:MAG TPA: hypothetical protein VFR87_21120 [Nocardioidaceae bacterium]|nr:hypothetical protein [Nocardioidaceae bacterium]